MDIGSMASKICPLFVLKTTKLPVMVSFWYTLCYWTGYSNLKYSNLQAFKFDT